MRFAAGRHPALEVRGKVCSSRKRAEADGTMPGMAFPMNEVGVRTPKDCFAVVPCVTGLPRDRTASEGAS